MASDNCCELRLCQTVAQAARMGNLADMQRLIKDGHPVDVSDNKGWRPVHDAAFHGNLSCLGLLLQQEVTQVNWQCFEGRSPLLLAAEKGHTECVQLLLERGANPNLPDALQYYPLFLAVKCGSLTCVQLLAEKGADLNCQLYCGSSPLHYAAQHGMTDIVDDLLQRGSQLDIAEENQLTPVFIAAQAGTAWCLRKLLKKAKELGDTSVVNAPAEDGATPLYLAAQEGHDECVRILLQHEASANITTSDPVSLPLHAALQFEHLQCAKLLLPLTDTNALARCDTSPFYFSTMHKDVCLTKCLIDGGLDCNARHSLLDEDKFKPKVLRYFHNNIKYSKRVSPLVLLALYEHPIKHAKILLQAGCTTNPRTPYEVPPLFVALQNFNYKLCKALITAGAKVNLYHPKVIGNMSVLISLHYWKGFNLLLMCGAELSSLFTSTSHLFKDSQPTYSRIDQLEDAMGDDEDYMDDENEVEELRFPLPFWQILADARYMMSSNGVTIQMILLRLLQFVGNVSLDSQLASYLDSKEQWAAISALVESPRTLTHLCRLRIRQSIGASQLINAACVGSLPLPAPVLDYLNYTELV